MQIRHKQPLLALEMTMRDVMDNLENAACYASLQGDNACFEILSIEPAQPHAPDRRAEVLYLSSHIRVDEKITRFAP